MQTKVTKYLIGFAFFLGYYLIARNIENKVEAFNKLANIGAKKA